MKNKIEYFDLSKQTVLKAISNNINPGILMNYELIDMVIMGEKVVLKWEKLLVPLTLEEVNGLYK